MFIVMVMFPGNIELLPSDLPKNANIDSILKIKNNNYILDINLSNILKNDIEHAAADLLKEQNSFLNKSLVENHIYQVVEISSNSISLIDKTIYDSTGKSNVFDIYNFSDKFEKSIFVDSLLKYSNGTFDLYSK